MFEKLAVTEVPITAHLARRWSGTAYDPLRPVPREQLLALLEAARWAPSCYGDQPWRYVVCDRSTEPAAWDRLYACLAEGNQVWAADAPVLMIALANSAFQHNGKPNRWGAYDSGAASMSLCVQATALGLMVHQMGGFDPERARSAFSIPEQFVPMAAIAVGYQLPESAVPDSRREREFAPRNRRPIDQTFFAGEWGRPFSAPGRDTAGPAA